ncbi:MAG: nitrogen fixation protein NifM [Gammaproteobacteria bacterium HGW-Gammaproteobacteria-10]|nr:MAG: nitrogen fixation protein NifM [Gammaproteobacteria bacterium HGW-Gammaproteobacteria-10]
MIVNSTIKSVEPYTLLRSSLSLFSKPPAELEREQLKKAAKQALNEYEIEARVLNSKEATGVVISYQELDAAFLEVRNRFGSDEEFDEALRQSGLDAERLRSALYRECKVNTILDRVSARAPLVSEVEIGIYYHAHPEKFIRPEQRAVRQILITINPEFPENQRENAYSRITEIRQKLINKPHKFEHLAMKFSECPSAVQGGVLGVFARGSLFSEIENELFNLKKDAISRIIETEIGFHIVQCLEIHYSETLSLEKAAPKIKQIMQERYRRNCQRTWLAGLVGEVDKVKDAR